jgi:talin
VTADVKSGDHLEYRKMHRPLKVRTLDNSVKTVIINDSLPVEELVLKVAEKLGG